MRKDVEAAFLGKSFAALSAKHGKSQSVELKLEDEYEEDSPVTILSFSGLNELSRWFQEKHQHTDHMLVPEPVVCLDFGGEFSCEYELPALTLHHGKYLLGFKAKREEQCTVLHRSTYIGVST